ncbi:MAG: hypothetical protein ACRET3_14465 [Burkholderiales bacterium]
MAISWIVFACVFGCGLLGMFLRAALPEHHLGTDSRDLVKLGMGLIATLAALTLGLLIASAKGSYDAQRNELTQMSANIILLEHVMAHYGPETREARDLLRRSVARMFARMWPETTSRPAQLEPTVEGLYDKIQALSPQNDAQRSIKAQAIGIITELGKARWLLFERRGGSVSVPFLVVLVFWLAMIFLSFGLLAPANPTVIATVFVCALSVSGAIFLILEVDRPFDGHILISSAPLRDALWFLDH